jgi:preprotein translocase subunit SecG
VDVQLTCSSPVYPEDVLRDAIRTLNLLFPQDDTTRAFLQSSKGKDFYDDPPLGMSRELNLNRYTYWRDELHELNQLFLKREQTSLWQALRDKENSLQRWTLIGVIIFNIITIIFGIISSVTAGFSTRASIQSLDIAREALALQKMQGQPPTMVTKTVTVKAF